jgi:hypothetical protein
VVDRRTVAKGLAGAAVAASAGGRTRASTDSQQSSPVGKTTSGSIRGTTQGGVSKFLGIPYGAPTGGASRFMPPQPPGCSDLDSCPHDPRHISSASVCPSRTSVMRRAHRRLPPVRKDSVIACTTRVSPGTKLATDYACPGDEPAVKGDPQRGPRHTIDLGLQTPRRYGEGPGCVQVLVARCSRSDCIIGFCPTAKEHHESLATQPPRRTPTPQ